MTLQDIYEQLSYGELRQLFLSGNDIDDLDVSMSQDQFQRLLPSIQLGLTELHKRFFLREGNIFVDLQPGKSTYTLTKAFAQSNGRSKEPVKYIDDTTEPFTNNLFKVERVFGTYLEERYEIPLNERDNPNSLFTTSYNTLVVPNDPEKALWLKETSRLDIRFRADHPEIQKNRANAAPMSTEIYLPPTHLEALLFYIASRIHNPIGMTPGAMHEGNNYFQRFMVSVEELKNQNYEIDDHALESKLYDRGFV